MEPAGGDQEYDLSAQLVFEVVRLTFGFFRLEGVAFGRETLRGL